MQTRFTRFALIICVLATLCSAASALDITKTPVPGVTIHQTIGTDPDSPAILNVVTVDLTKPDLNAAAVLAGNTVFAPRDDKGRGVVSSMVRESDALLGVNADYFWLSGDPLGLCIVDGEFVSEPFVGRPAMGITREHKVVFDTPKLDARLTLERGTKRQIDGINRPRGTNQLVVYTPTFGPSTMNQFPGVDVVCQAEGLPVQLGKEIKLRVSKVCQDAKDTPIPADSAIVSADGPAGYFLKENLKPGDEFTIKFDLVSTAKIDWTQVEQSVGGGPWLVKNSETFIDREAGGFAPDFASVTHPRTAVGATADGKLLMVTQDGRQSISQGLSLKSLSETLIKLGAVNAINLDGGGSTTLSVKGMVLNSPSDGSERPVANALVVKAKTTEEKLPDLKICGIDKQVAVGERPKLYLCWGDSKQSLTDDQLSKVVWGTTNSIGFIDQSGTFIPMRVRKGTIQAYYGGQVVSLDVNVVVGEPAKITGRLKPDNVDPLKASISATVVDEFGNPTPGQEVTLSADGGKLSAAKITTDAKGEIAASVNWDPSVALHSVRFAVAEMTASLKADVTTGGVGVPSKLTAKLVPDAKLRAKSMVIACLADAGGRPISGREITISVKGGESEVAKGITDARGEFTTPVTWTKTAAEGSVTLSCGALETTISGAAQTQDAPKAGTKLRAKMIPDPRNGLRCTVVGTLVDAGGKPLEGKTMSATLVGGKLDVQKGVTDKNGEFKTVVTLNSRTAKSSITLASEGLTVKLDIVE